MANNNPVDNLSRKYLQDKKHELIWALHMQNFNYEQIGFIFNNMNRSSVLRTIRKMPRGWKTKWKKIEN